MVEGEVVIIMNKEEFRIYEIEEEELKKRLEEINPSDPDEWKALLEFVMQRGKLVYRVKPYLEVYLEKPYLEIHLGQS